MTNLCGDCRMCCKLLGVHELNKPPEVRCPHVCNHGCGIYETRPESCRTYECFWLSSQEWPDRALPIELRPDRCGVVFDGGGAEKAIVARVKPEQRDKLNRPAVQALMAAFKAGGISVYVVSGSQRRVVIATSEGKLLP